MSHFTLVSHSRKAASRQLLGIAPDRLVISYLGSVGSWYMLDEMLRLFKIILKRKPNAVFLFVTPSDPDYIILRAREFKLDPAYLVIREASRKEVPEFIAASDINISFIKPVYSKISSSPTKLGEVLAMGIPVISNAGVGDVAEIVKQTNGGIVLYGFSDTEMEAAAEHIPDLLKLDPASIREAAAGIYDLVKGVDKYLSAYQQVLGA
jgi:glycosyltransferase involved in cell wall biosynthesis